MDMRDLIAGLAGGASVLGANINKRKDAKEAEQRAEDRAMRLLLAKPQTDHTVVTQGEDENGPGIFIVDKDTATKTRITDKALAQLTGAPVTSPAPVGPRQSLLRKPGDAMPAVPAPTVAAPVVPPPSGGEEETHGTTDIPPNAVINAAPIFSKPKLGLRPVAKAPAPKADPLERKSPITIKVDGQVQQALVDGHGKFYDAMGREITGKIEHYEPPHEPGVIPVQRSDGQGGVETVLAPKVVGQVVPGPNTRTPAAIQKDVASNRTQMDMIDLAADAVAKHPAAFGAKRALGDVVPIAGGVADFINQRADPEGVDARALVANISSLKIKDRSGSAVTVSEFPRLAPFIPRVGDTPEVIVKKLKRLRQEIEIETKYLEQGGALPTEKERAEAKASTQPKGKAGSGDPEFDAIMASVKKRPPA